MFLLNILWNLLVFGKCLSISFRKVFPKFFQCTKSFSISKRTSNISSNKATFNNAAPFYNGILSARGYKENLTYQQDLTPSKKVRQRKIWFNPPYSVNIETNIGKTFLKLIAKHFPKTSKFHKIFNRNNVSYSCLPNFANMIKSHNNRILSKRKTKINLNVIANRKILVL